MFGGMFGEDLLGGDIGAGLGGVAVNLAMEGVQSHHCDHLSNGLADLLKYRTPKSDRERAAVDFARISVKSAKLHEALLN